MSNCLHCNNLIKGKTSKKYCDDACRMAFTRTQSEQVTRTNNTPNPNKMMINPNKPEQKANPNTKPEHLNLLIQGKYKEYSKYKECECLTYKKECEHLTEQEHKAIIQGKKLRVIEYLLNDSRMKGNVFHFGDVIVTP